MINPKAAGIDSRTPRIENGWMKYSHIVLVNVAWLTLNPFEKCISKINKITLLNNLGNMTVSRF